MSYSLRAEVKKGLFLACSLIDGTTLKEATTPAIVRNQRMLEADEDDSDEESDSDEDDEDEVERALNDD
jgi:hypothetical protein